MSLLVQRLIRWAPNPHIKTPREIESTVEPLISIKEFDYSIQAEAFELAFRVFRETEAREKARGHVSQREIDIDIKGTIVSSGRSLSQGFWQPG